MPPATGYGRIAVKSNYFFSADAAAGAVYKGKPVEKVVSADYRAIRVVAGDFPGCICSQRLVLTFLCSLLKTIKK